MIIKTHLVIGLAVFLFFVGHVNSKVILFFSVIFATMLPDIDSTNSFIGHYRIFRPLQVFTRHRGMLHSFSFCFLASLIVAIVFPKAGLGFFLGYSFHLLADSFTIDGIRPFWPSQIEISGFVRSGGKFDGLLYVFFVLLDVLLIILFFAR